VVVVYLFLRDDLHGNRLSKVDKNVKIDKGMKVEKVKSEKAR
jgi:hypothetical protein